MSLLILGTVAFDEIESPFGKSGKIIGGAAQYAALSAAAIYDKCRMVSIIGEDFPQDFINTLNSRNIDTEGIELVKGEKSFFWAGRYHNNLNSRDTLVTDLNVLAKFDPKLPEAYTRSEFVFLGNVTPAIQKSVVSQLAEKPRLIGMDTMNFWMDVALDELKQALKLIDVLIINDEEARQLSNEYSLVKAAKKIMQMGPRFLVIKKGEHGALLFDQDDLFFCPALPLEEVFDPTGAGDTFAGGFMGYLAATEDVSFENMKRAVVFGSAMASFCVEKFGNTRLLEITQKDIEERIKAFTRLMSVDYKWQSSGR